MDIITDSISSTRKAYRNLPESSYSLPDSVVAVAQMEEERAAFLSQWQIEYDAAKAKMLADLRQDWTDEEIKEAGF